MSVRRLAEPPKPSFLLLGEVSQSHAFMCNACKPMHPFRHNGTAEGHVGARMGRYQNGSEQTGTTGQQQYSECQYRAMVRATGATLGGGGGAALHTEEATGTITWKAAGGLAAH